MNFIHNTQESLEEYNIDPRELAKLKQMIEKVLNEHGITCSKCYTESNKLMELKRRYPDAVDFDEDMPLYEVDKIVGHRLRNGVREYYVQWANLPFDGAEDPYDVKCLERCGLRIEDYWYNLARKNKCQNAMMNIPDTDRYTNPFS